jgi:hypothetical protein
MKTSKQLPKWLRQRMWAVFMKMKPSIRNFVYRNSFETFSKDFEAFRWDKNK